MEVEQDGPSFPSNYVTIHDLKQRWLQQQKQKQKQISNQDSEFNPKPTTHDSVPHRSINPPPPPPPPLHSLHNPPEHDSASKTLPTNHPKLDKIASTNSRPPKPIAHQNPSQSEHEPEHVEEKKQHHPSRNQKMIWKPEPQPEPEPVDKKKQHQHSSNQKPKQKTTQFPPHNDDAAAVASPAPVKQHRHRNLKPRYKTKMPPFDPQNDDSGDGDVAVAAPVKEQHQAERWSRNKKVFRPKTPPFDVAPNDDAVVEVEALAVAAPVKLQHQAGDRRGNQKPNHESKTITFSPQSDDGGHGVGVGAEDVAIAPPVKDQAGRWSRNKVFQPMTPPFDAAGDDDDDVLEVEAVAVAAPVKLEHQVGRRRRNKKVFRPKTPPFDAADDGLVEVEAVAVAASVKDINVCNVSHTKEGYGRFQGGSEPRTWSRSNRHRKPPSWGKKGQISQVWVKKGESAPN